MVANVNVKNSTMVINVNTKKLAFLVIMGVSNYRNLKLMVANVNVKTSHMAGFVSSKNLVFHV